MTDHMDCAAFHALLPEYLEGSLLETVREQADAHALDCEACAALAADLRRIAGEAAALPVLTPARDLWAGIETRIEAPVVELPSRVESRESRVTRLPAHVQRAAAAVLLIAATAGVTWYAARRPAARVAAAADSSALRLPSSVTPARPVSRPTVEQTYDREIAALRKLVDERRGELDSGTVAILEKNLQVIDQAIAESKAALAKNPSNALLLDRLTDAYDTKLQVLRTVATIPLRG